MKRAKRANEDADIPGLTCCVVCKCENKGRLYEFWTGHRDKFSQREYLDKVVIKYQYSDLRSFRVFVCDSCVAGLRQRHYLPYVIGWGLLALPGVIGLAVLPFLGWDRVSALMCLGMAALCGVPALLGALFYIWRMMTVPNSASNDKIVLTRVRWEKGLVPKGYEAFTQAEYEDMFDR